MTQGALQAAVGMVKVVDRLKFFIKFRPAAIVDKIRATAVFGSNEQAAHSHRDAIFVVRLDPARPQRFGDNPEHRPAVKPEATCFDGIQVKRSEGKG